MFTCMLSLTLAVVAAACPPPGTPKNGQLTTSRNATSYATGETATYTCNKGFELLGPAKRVCQTDNTWYPDGHPFCLTNVVDGALASESTSGPDGDASVALDGDNATCTATLLQKSAWFSVELREDFPVSVVKLNFPDRGLPPRVTVTIRVGNTSTKFEGNPVCNIFNETLVPGRSLFLPCFPTRWGRFVSVHLDRLASLSICELAVYSEAEYAEERQSSSTTPRPEPQPSYGGLGSKGLYGVCMGFATLVGVVCLCCYWRKCKKCCCKQPSETAITEEFEASVIREIGGHPLEGGYQMAWHELYKAA